MPAVEPARTRDLDGLATVALSALWALPLLVIGVGGDFPLNDDWAYARTTQDFLETGRFERDAWTYTPIVTNVGLGVLFSWVFGFSFEALRLSGVFMGWLGLVGSYWLCREVGVKPLPSFVAAAVVGFDPVYLNLSFTFMTDVPFTALSVWSLVLCARGLARSSWLALVGGTVLALVAALSRQPGLAVVPAVLVAALVAPVSPLRRALLPWGWVLLGLAVAALALAVALGAPLPLRLPEFVRPSSGDPSLLRAFARHGGISFLNLGLFLSPVLALLLSGGIGAGRRVGEASAALAVALFGGLALAGVALPVGGNVLHDLGLGPSTLHGARVLPGAPAGAWWLVTALAVFAGSFAVALAAADLAAGGLRGRPERLLLLAFPALYLAPLFVADNFFDRYLLPTLAPLAAYLLTSIGARAGPPRRDLGFATSLLVGLAVFSVLGTRDYLERNRARWSLLAPLVEGGVSADRVDAGFEFDGWSGLHPATVWAERRGGRLDDFVVSHVGPQHMPGFRVVDSRWYRRLLPPGTEGVVLYERVAPNAPAPEPSDPGR